MACASASEGDEAAKAVVAAAPAPVAKLAKLCGPRGRRGPQKKGRTAIDERLDRLRARPACNTATPADPLEDVLEVALGMLGFSLAAPAESAGDV